MALPRLNVVFGVWQCDKKNHGWREGPPLTVACEVSICWPGLHPPGKSAFKRKKNTAFRHAPRVPHSEHWPVINANRQLTADWEHRSMSGVSVNLTAAVPLRTPSFQKRHFYAAIG
jgi:hypothetical protein